MKDQLKKAPVVKTEVCPIIHALEIIGGKWRLPVIWEIFVAKNIRYNELKRSIPGITNTFNKFYVNISPVS